MDIPNSRSSHSIPTPRGGGVAIVVSYLATVIYFAFVGEIFICELIVYAGAGGGVALIGLIDDYGHIGVRWRLLGHLAAGTIAVLMIGGMPQVSLFGWSIQMGFIGSVGAVLYMAWMINLHNFMDGIDGLAAGQAVFMGAALCGLYSVFGRTDLMWLSGMLAAAAGGFLFWNFAPAKIFMGDSGSGFLGYIVGAIILQGAWVSPLLFWSGLILAGVFIVDASWTLLHRVFKRKKFYEAHRSHAYQIAVQRCGQHRLVMLAVMAINLFWLLPIAVWVALGSTSGGAWTVVAYVPLIFAAVHFNAGAD